MISLNRTLKTLEDQRTRYRILLNRSRYQSDIERVIWQRSAVSSISVPKKLSTQARSNLVRDKQCALETFEDVRKNMGVSPLNIETIMAWHVGLLRGTEPELAGQFRYTRAHWLQSTMIFSNWEKIPALMDALVDGINKRHIPAYYWQENPDRQFQALSHNPMINAIEANYNFIAIHPFQDGNKRTARLMTSWFLGQQDYIPLCIYERQGYVNGIESYARTHRPNSLYGFMLDQMCRSYDDAIHEVQSMEKVIVAGNKHGNGARLSMRGQHHI